MFLIVVDVYPKWLEVVPLSAATSTVTIEHLCLIFATHGVPKVFVSDNGSQFTSGEFDAFMKTNGIRHVRSLPYHPPSNGLAERAVQSIKENMKRSPSGSLQDRVSRFVFWYRLTPHSTTGVSPAELLLRRRPRSQLDLLKPEVSSTVKKKQDKQTANHDRHTELRNFEGDLVYARDFPSGKDWLPGEVTEIRGPLSYHVRLSDGRIVRRHVDAVRKRTIIADNDQEIPSPTVDSGTAPDGDSQTAEDETSTPAVGPSHRSTRTRQQPSYLGFENDS